MNRLYDKGRESFLNGELSWRDGTIKAVLVDTALYTVDFANHQFLSDIPLGARIATFGPLTGKTTTAGVADANDVSLASVSGASGEAIVLFNDTGAQGTSRLIGYIDTATGLPVTPNSGGMNIVWDDGANKIFKL